jgi:hypothetical protein
MSSGPIPYYKGLSQEHFNIQEKEENNTMEGLSNIGQMPELGTGITFDANSRELSTFNDMNIIDQATYFNAVYAKYITIRDSTNTDVNNFRISDNTISNLATALVYNIRAIQLTIPTTSSDQSVVIDNYNRMKAIRNDLDEKMKQLYNIQNSYVNDNKIKYDSTIYAGVLWSVLASSVIYYVFTKL